MHNRFRFRGHAIGAAGHISHPFREIIEVQASCALPESGGHARGRSTDFRYREILHFDLAYTEVGGGSLIEDGKPVHHTLVKARIERLDIMGMIKADSIMANLVAVHHGDPDGDPDGEPSIKLIGTHFENLRIAGVPVKVDLAIDVFDKHDNHQSLRDAYKNKHEVRALFDDITLKHRWHQAPEHIRRWFPEPPKDDSEMPASHGDTHISLVRKLEPAGKHIECWGHAIHIDGFGTIRLAELSIAKHTRRLTMLRVDLGCPVVGGIETGGTGN